MALLDHLTACTDKVKGMATTITLEAAAPVDYILWFWHAASYGFSSESLNDVNVFLGLSPLLDKMTNGTFSNRVEAEAGVVSFFIDTREMEGFNKTYFLVDGI
jgi:hypothetical protein